MIVNKRLVVKHSTKSFNNRLFMKTHYWKWGNLSLRHAGIKFTSNPFLCLILGWCVGLDMNRLIEGGPWCFPHHWHKTWNIRWCWNDEKNHRIDWDVTYSKEDKENVEVYCRGGFPWTLYDMKNGLEALNLMRQRLDIMQGQYNVLFELNQRS